jgi:hypothetical protein
MPTTPPPEEGDADLQPTIEASELKEPKAWPHIVEVLCASCLEAEAHVAAEDAEATTLL